MRFTRLDPSESDVGFNVSVDRIPYDESRAAFLKQNSLFLVSEDAIIFYFGASEPSNKNPASVIL